MIWINYAQDKNTLILSQSNGKMMSAETTDDHISSNVRLSPRPKRIYPCTG